LSKLRHPDPEARRAKGKDLNGKILLRPALKAAGLIRMTIGKDSSSRLKSGGTHQNDRANLPHRVGSALEVNLQVEGDKCLKYYKNKHSFVSKIKVRNILLRKKYLACPH